MTSDYKVAGIVYLAVLLLFFVLTALSAIYDLGQPTELRFYCLAMIEIVWFVFGIVRTAIDRTQ